MKERSPSPTYLFVKVSSWLTTNTIFLKDVYDFWKLGDLGILPAKGKSMFRKGNWNFWFVFTTYLLIYLSLAPRDTEISQFRKIAEIFEKPRVVVCREETHSISCLPVKMAANNHDKVYSRLSLFFFATRHAMHHGPYWVNVKEQVGTVFNSIRRFTKITLIARITLNGGCIPVFC